MANQRRIFIYSIGVNEYDQYPTLSWCSNDALAIIDAFKARFGVVTIRLSHTGQDSPLPPTHSTFKDFLNEVSDADLTERDVVIFYFAGHGFSFNGRDYLVCCDSAREGTDTVVATDDIIASLAASNAGTSIFIADACRQHMERDTNLFSESTAELARRKSVIAFFGCSPGEVCHELAKLGHGVFTQSLLSVFGQGSSATPLEIDAAVIAEVAELCTQHKLGKQTPYTAVSPIQRVALDIFNGRTKSVLAGRQRCIIIAGPPNAGKTTLGQRLASLRGSAHIEMSAYAWKRFDEYPQFPGSIQDFMENVVWKENDKGTIARDLVSSVPQAKELIICGPRTLEEMEVLRGEDWDCYAIFISACQQIRFQRHLRAVKRDRFTPTYVEVLRRDYREFSWV